MKKISIIILVTTRLTSTTMSVASMTCIADIDVTQSHEQIQKVIDGLVHLTVAKLDLTGNDTVSISHAFI